MCQLYVSDIHFVDPGVQQLYTRVYKPCTWGCTKSVHPGGDENCSLAK